VNSTNKKDWRRLVLESWPAVTASDLLQGNPNVWVAEGLTPPCENEAVAWAAVGRLFRYGKSIAVRLPISRDASLPRLAFYLHRLRLDAAQGLVRSPWLNRIDMWQRSDLLIFGRPRGMLREFVTSPVMRPAVVSASSTLERAEFQRTLLIDGHGDLLATLELLAQHSRPFGIVLDVTAQGCPETAFNLAMALPGVFPKVPIIALGHTGQASEQFSAMHNWNVRLSDSVGLSSTPLPPTAKTVHVVAARDAVMNDFVKRLGFLVWNLKRIVEETAGRTPELAAIVMVERVLHSLNVPLAVHEQLTLRRVRGGPFAIRTLESWLGIASRLKGRRGDVQALFDEIIRLIQNNLQQLRDAIPGRSELLVTLGRQALQEHQHLSILVGNKRDALILQNWMEEQLGSEAIEFITTTAMDGATSVPPAHVDYVIYAAPLYPSRLHWLGLSAKHKQVLCHPFEKERVCQQVDCWWRSNALPSANTGDKYRLWSLDWGQGRQLLDLSVKGGDGSAVFVQYEERSLDGRYPQALRVAQLEVFRRYDDWLQSLLSEPALHEIQIDVEAEDLQAREMVILHLEGHAEPLRWPADRTIMRLDEDTFTLCFARELTVGNELVLLGSSEDRVATQRELFDMFIQNNHGLAQTLRVAEKWQEFVDLGVTKLKTVAELTRHLRSRKVDITAAAVGHWHAGRVIGPHDSAAIRIIADLAEIPGADKLSKMVENAIVVIRSEHRRIGSDLRKAIKITRSRDVSAVQIGSRRFSREVFDTLVEVCRIAKIDHPAHNPASFQARKSIKDVARDFAARYVDKLVFTTACERSMRRSAYENVSAFGGILNVLIEGFYPMYADKSVSLKQVEERLATIPASYAGQMSDVTKGKFESDYIRQYGGQKVDISRHIKLGKSFDPKHTLRLHFHWDAEAAKIVVHHAGAHLPTLSS